jgi:HK97 family phage major capsid protein
MKTKLNFKQLGEAIREKSKIIGTIFQEAGEEMDFSKVKCLGDGDSTAKVEKIHSLEAELKDLKGDYEEYSALAKSRLAADELASYEGAVPKGEPGEKAAAKKTIGEMIMASKAVHGERMRVFLDIDPKGLLAPEMKADFFTTSGWAPENIRQPGYVLYPTRPIAVIDNLPIYPTTQNSVVYMLETTKTSAAAEKAEGGAAAESSLALTETSQAVQEIATFVPTSKVQLEDVAFAEAYLTNTLNFLVRQKMDYQILNGDGSAPNLKGTLNIGGSLQTQAKGSDPTPDAIYKAFDLIRTVGYTEPSVLFANPKDWQDVRLLRTADGVYIFGNPADGGPNTIWGVRVVQTAAVVEATMITGDYANFAYVAMRRGVEVEMSSGYSDYFLKGKLAVLASLRCAVVHTRTSAFATVTGV